ncbi:MAG: Holliday junction resolvase [Nanoarchaeota archaeon]|nr:Holliday junction resolvase [Nanoarchaeota archaeon]
MSSKGKGTRLERELFHMFYQTGRYMPVRVAGSGSTTLPSTDLLIGGQGKYFAIECKAIKKGRKYIEKGRINELMQFSKIFGALPLLAIRFNNQPWYFLKIEDLEQSDLNYIVYLELVKKKGLTFEELTK